MTTRLRQAGLPSSGRARVERIIQVKGIQKVIKQGFCLSAVCALACCLAVPVWASHAPAEVLRVQELLAMSLEELINVEITLATGTAKSLRKAPAVASVITAADIEKMGAVTLHEALESVPGLHVESSGINRFSNIYSIRGIHTQTNPHVLMLINGVPYREAYGNNRSPTYRMSVAQISRVEVIRGPVSALHGADAFSGVINVITKDSSEIDGIRAGMRYGSFSTLDTWLQYGGLFKGWDTAVSVELQKSSGDNSRIIDRDALGTAASALTPGVMETDFNNVDSNIKLHRDNWTIDLYGSWQNDNAMGPALQRVVPGSEQDNMGLLGAITYNNSDWLEDWELSGRVSGSFLEVDSWWRMTPPGAGNMIGNPISTTTNESLDLSGIFHGFNRHVIRLGAGTGRLQLETDSNQNFIYNPGLVFVPMRNTKGTPYIYCDDQVRDLWYVLAQDEWSLSSNWELTAGVRYDKYSDFGSTTNPRAALVWETRPDLTTKLLYGQAFRAPSFGEQYGRANPAALGNPNIKPENIETRELVFDYQPFNNLRTIMSFFSYDIEDINDIVNGFYQNVRNQEAWGYELEADWQARDDLRLRANFARQRSKDTDTKVIVADAPGMQFYANAHWMFRPDWSLNAQYNWVADRKRAAGDSRGEIADYDQVGLTLRRKNIKKHWDAALAVRNLFDEDARIPSDGRVPNDYPGEGRSLWLEARYSY